jgi:FkbM family methyltransferase
MPTQDPAHPESAPDLETVEFYFPTVTGRRPKFYVPKGDMMGPTIINTRQWEYTFITQFYSWAGDHGSFLEVGANIGADTILARDYFPYAYAFEPSSRNRDLLIKNLVRNGIGNVHLFPFAVSDRPGKMRLYFGGTGGNSLVQNSPSKIDSEEVEVVTLDDAMPADVTNVSYIHIDTEGHDIKVLRGARRFIARQKQRPIIRIEFQPHLLVANGSKIEELLEIIEEFKYRPAMNGSIHVAFLTPFILSEFFRLWQPTEAWVDVFLLP